MGYNKIISYGKIVEIYHYEERPRSTGRKKAATTGAATVPLLSSDRQNVHAEKQPPKVRTREHARRAVLSFRRLVAANLGGNDNPVLASLTYRENIDDLGRCRKDFNAFAKALRDTFDNGLRYICVAEFQKRGAVHFHALIWGLPKGTVDRERSSRLVASLWGQGFVDLVQTDGNIKIASYLAKYMGKMFADPRLAGRKAYIASRNILRPMIDKDALIMPYFYGANGIDLSTATIFDKREYDTQWLGRCNYKQYHLEERYDENRKGGDADHG